MKVLKFGGSSVGNAERINKVIEILDQQYISKNQKIAVVFSAVQGVTDQLIKIGTLALNRDKSYKYELNSLIDKHHDIVKNLNSISHRIKIIKELEPIFTELNEIAHGIYLVKELSDRTLDYLMSFGEKLSCKIISLTMKNRKYNCDFLDSSLILKTDDTFGYARVNFESTNKNIAQYFRKNNSIQIITGFIGSTDNDEITTIGRGGSDYTASIYGAALNASEIHIWTDVDGILTADPRKVSDSFSLKAVTYEEAMELSHFGAKVIHPPTMHPALKKKIKIKIKNTFNPSFPGTVILERESSIVFNMKGISSIDDVSLVRVQGSGMVGVTGVASRLFSALAKNDINIIMITQGSSEHSICFAILPKHGIKAKKSIEIEFKDEISEGKIGEVVVEDDLSIIAVVGEDMKHTPGVSGKVFQALGKNGINIHAIAQGSSELNISLVIGKQSLQKALNVLHDDLFVNKHQTLNIFMAGPGLVGSALINLIKNRLDFVRTKLNTNIRLIGLSNSKKMIIDPNGIDLNNWEEVLKKSDLKSDPKLYIEKIKELNLSNSMFVDCTATQAYVPNYDKILSIPISIVTPNKIANSRRQFHYDSLKTIAKKNNVQFRYGTNVGAALPIINTLRDLINNGDEITKIEGVLSGTLSYIFNSLNGESSFSQVVKEAQKGGFTEPDPRDNLSGLDVARKLLILIREAQIPFEMKNVKIQNLVPKKARSVETVDEFYSILEENDKAFSSKIIKANEKIKNYVT
jgi:aspartokinase/homoserine dehydrogenase 1